MGPRRGRCHGGVGESRKAGGWHREVGTGEGVHTVPSARCGEGRVTKCRTQGQPDAWGALPEGVAYQPHSAAPG